jgi:4-diphosphocytidyl-2-C-methyl-D-erythritol kinase
VGRQSVRVRVPAKVNLHLSVGPVRADGFHELVTVFLAVGLFDEVIARSGPGLRLAVAGDQTAGVPADDRNLAWRAAQLVAERAGVAADVHLELTKAIPVAGGMAGGSADAAATLVACAQLWQTGMSADELSALAAELGSDVAFPLVGGAALGTGRGEQLVPVETAGPFHWVFALAPFGISAGAAFSELDRQRADGHAAEPIGTADAVLKALRDGNPAALGAAIGNDLEPAAVALAPGLARTLEVGRRHAALAGFVSGSGPTCAFLVPDEDAARELAAGLDAAGVADGTRIVSGPVPGATIIG